MPASFTDVGFTPDDIVNDNAVPPVYDVDDPNGYVIVILLALMVQVVGLVTRPPDGLVRVHDVVDVNTKNESVVGNVITIFELAVRLLVGVNEIK